ncbi:MAG: PKD domain-containing protein [Salibacteraceae bacterium]
MNQLTVKYPYRLVVGLIALLVTVWGCRKDLPEAGSIEDLTPPSAAFDFDQFSPDNYLEVTFSNQSTSSTDYLWEFGDGATSTEAEPVHVYTADGTYTVKLTASDKLGVNSVSEQTFTLTEPAAFIPPILEASFEDGQLDGGSGDGRDSWRNSDLGGVIQITSDPVKSGDQAAKLTGDPSDKRIGFQQLTVTENTVYDVSFFYTMEDDQPGSLTVSILSGPVTSHAEALAATIGSVTVNDQSDPKNFTRGTVSFFSGASTEVAVYFFNDGSVETRLDDFSIDIGQGTIPPTAAFTHAKDPGNYLQVDFTNTSINATSYDWDFGDGNTSTDASPTHTYAMDGSYTVTLTASNPAGEMDVAMSTINVSPPSNVMITNPSFDNEPVRDDNRVDWRNQDLEADANVVFGASSYVLQTSSTARTGDYAGKLPTMENSSSPRRWLYQAVTVDPNTDYKIKGWIRNKDGGVGSTVTFAIYDAPFSTASTIGDPTAILASEDYDASTGHDTDTWTEASITFNSGSSTEIVLFITNDYTLNGDPSTEESETFLDDFSIEEL